VNTKTRTHRPVGWQVSLLTMAGCLVLGAAGAADEPFIPQLINSSTIPDNGDVNPYGVAFVPEGFPAGGTISPGDVLVANFNNSANLQGTGTTMVRFTPGSPPATPGAATTFFVSALPGLSTALGVLRGGFVLVGNVPTTDGTYTTIGQGALQIIDRHGNLLQAWASASFLDGSGGLAVDDHGSWARIFIANVLNGTVSRLDVLVTAKGLTLQSWATIATGYTHTPNAAAVVLGPTGLAYSSNADTLYVAATADNAVYAVEQAGNRHKPIALGRTVFADARLRGPLALRLAPTGNLISANGDAVNGDPQHPSEIIEFTTTGQFVRSYDVDPSQGGAFGIDTVRDAHARFNYAVIDDVTNVLSVYRLAQP